LLDTDIKLENDVVVAAVAESLNSIGSNSERFMYIIWGTGVGGCLAEKIDGKIKFSVSEMGHQSIDWKGRHCSCGQNGCLENYIGGKAFKELYGVNAEEISDNKIWDEVAERAAFGIHNMMHILPVDLIIFGGGLITKQPHLLDRIKLKLEEELKVFPVPKLELSDKSEKNGLYGAAGLFFIDMI
jgi:glucokinase